MQSDILGVGPPPLTEEAADAAIDSIDFIATVVHGYKVVDVTKVVRQLWRAYVAAWYPSLSWTDRVWFANAPEMLYAIQTQWPLLDPLQRGIQVQQWAMMLPQMLAMIEPVLNHAQSLKLQPRRRGYLNEWRQQLAKAQPSGSYTQAEAINELNRRGQQTASLTKFSTTMANSTINLMRTMSRR